MVEYGLHVQRRGVFVNPFGTPFEGPFLRIRFLFLQGPLLRAILRDVRNSDQTSDNFGVFNHCNRLGATPAPSSTGI